MSYTITVRVHQTNPSWSYIVEKTNWNFANGGTWTEVEGQQILKMGGSGTSGTLRFTSDKDDFFVFATGVHNYKPWTDIVVDLKSNETATIIQPTYYSDAPGNRGARLWAQAPETDAKTASGKSLSIKVTGSGNDYVADITIA